jgi:ubiquinone/menaquinone biosynthesis C-methylase UbiE
VVAALGSVRDPQVIDVGGGSGVLAVALAEMGCAVTVVDTSADALATLHRRAAEAGIRDRVTGVQGDFDSLPDAAFDLVLCHSVLEYVEDPAVAVRRLVERIRPGGTLSLLVANRVATVLNRALAGHVRQARQAALDPDGRWGSADALQRRFDTDTLLQQLAEAGLEPVEVHGIGVFADLIPALDREPDAAEELRLLEERLSAIPPYRDLASRLHVLARPIVGAGT